jgi:RND superfamily putative drug exporter
MLVVMHWPTNQWEAPVNLAARAGRFSAAHWKTATFGWLALVIAAVVVGGMVGTVKLTNSQQGSGETGRAAQMAQRAGFGDHAGENVLVQSRTLTANDPAFRETVDRVVAHISPLTEVQDVRSPYELGNRGQISRNGHSALVQFQIKGSSDTAGDRIVPVENVVSALQREAPRFTVAEFGDASADHAITQTTNKGLSHAETLSLPITFLVLLVAFGAFVAAGLPVLLAFSAVLGAGGLAAVASHLVPASGATSSVMLLMGMAVGVDYSLFYLKRERAERRNGLSERESLARAAATSGQAVLVSGFTVLIAMAGMLLTGSKVFTSIGVGAMLVVFVAMVGSLTVLPALLSKLGDNVEKGRVRRPRTESRLWNLVLRPVLRFPKAAAVLSAAALIVISLPVFGLHTSLLGPGDIPSSVPISHTYKQIQRAFPGAQIPAQVVVQNDDVTSPAMRAQVKRLTAIALASGQAHKPIQVTLNRPHTYEQINIPLAGSGNDKASMAALAALRNHWLPETLGTVPGTAYAVTGDTAATHDFTATIKHAFPIVFAFVLGLAFLLLLVTFRSVVIPLTSVVLTMLSVGAAYGVLVWVFQDGHLQNLLGFHSNGAVVTWLPLFLFAVLYGLSMDYHVFIVSRIRELHDRGASTSDAVADGIRQTASTVTAAAAVMVAVFGVFASLPMLDIKELGVGLATAVLIDATIIRGVLLPATMTLLGERNWYLPRWLGWLPRVNVHGPRARVETA